MFVKNKKQLFTVEYCESNKIIFYLKAKKIPNCFFTIYYRNDGLMKYLSVHHQCSKNGITMF